MWSSLGRVTKVLYPVIAKRKPHFTGKVERAMRHAIETAWSRGDVEVLHRTFGYSVDANRGRPTNSSFIAKLADQIRLELRTRKLNPPWLGRRQGIGLQRQCTYHERDETQLLPFFI